MKTFGRREFLSAGALTAGGALLTSQLTFARAASERQARLVFIILRGALDGLAAVPPIGDPDYGAQRRELALAAPGTTSGALALNGFFGLHPSLGFLRDAYAARELIVFHAIASPYRERSHFDGQNVLENGSVRPHALQTGWLNRALACLQTDGASSREMGVALGQNVPLVMRGPAEVTSWSPSRLATLDEDTLQRISDLYAGDPVLANRLADALAANNIAAEAADGSMRAASAAAEGANEGARPAEKGARYAEIVRAAAGFLRSEDGPRVAVFDTTGWDTHANEGNAQGQLASRLAALDEGLRTLKEELGAAWRNTAVLLATEFGRTVAVNGTRGTDHGTATAAFLAGGAVQGGRVVADWPGLSTQALYQGRDLQPSTDLRSVLKGVLAEHLLVPSKSLENAVFPDSRNAKALQGLIRT